MRRHIYVIQWLSPSGIWHRECGVYKSVKTRFRFALQMSVRLFRDYHAQEVHIILLNEPFTISVSYLKMLLEEDERGASGLLQDLIGARWRFVKKGSEENAG